MDAGAFAMPVQEANRRIGVVLGVMGTVVVAGAAVDVVLRRRMAEAKRRDWPRFWALGLLLGSYGCLIPGLVLNLFSAEASISVMGFTKDIAALSESMVELIHGMFSRHLYLAGLLVALYAMVIPALKLCLLALGFYFRSGACIRAVKLVSKWAAPDLFAYILMTHLFRSLDRPPKVNSRMELGVGFTCFCVFCAMSTISSLGIRTPAPQDAQARQALAALRAPPPAELVGAPPSSQAPASRAEGDAAPAPPGAQLPRRLALVVRRWRGAAAAAAPTLRLGQVGASVVVLLLSCLFLVSFAFGLVVPCMTLHVDMALWYEHHPLLKEFALIIDAQNLPALLRSEVSVWACLVGLAEWAAEGDGNSAIALAMYALFAVLLPLLDVAALLLASLTGRWRQAALRASHVFRKLSMLDVSIMGVVIVVLALSSLRTTGAIVSIGPGIWPLIAAELSHYALILWVEDESTESPHSGDGVLPQPCHKEDEQEVSPPSELSTAEGSSSEAADRDKPA